MPPHKKETKRNNLEVSDYSAQREVKCGKKCESVSKVVSIPISHCRPEHIKVKKVLDCDKFECKDCTVNKGQCPIHVKQRDVKIRVRPEDQHIQGDEIDVYLQKPKGKVHGPTVKVHVAAPEVVFDRQKIEVLVEKNKLKKGKPVVRVHCPPPNCHVMEPKVHVKIDKGRNVCLPKPEICVRYARCDKPAKPCKEKKSRYAQEEESDDGESQ